MKSGLPIDEVLPELRSVLLRHRNAVVEAPPGAGKSTVVPIALLDEPWLRGGKLIMLEPRRLATRAVAARMAATLGESPGETVGYRMRLETRVGKRMRIEVVTEGVFTRMLQSDPALEGVGAACPPPRTCMRATVGERMSAEVSALRSSAAEPKRAFGSAAIARSTAVASATGISFRRVRMSTSASASRNRRVMSSSAWLASATPLG